MSIAENVAKIEERILKACGASGRKRDEITFMGVSKFVPVELVEEAFKAGVNCFGESRVKEAIEKFDAFKERSQLTQCSVQLHLIGSLQRNKAKAAAAFFDCIQSVDRIELITELARHTGTREKPLSVLLELHTGEETKSGFTSMDSLFIAAEKVLESGNLKPQGLMTMAPFTEDTELIRASFRQLVKAQKELEKRFGQENWKCLSMGMSHDFEIAVEEGSTMLRIGSLVFEKNRIFGK
jgi:pyridoxal phosphate enzyme (YggS family)